MGKIVSLVIILSFIFISCASIVSKSDWPVTIRSNPDQADVTITDIKEGKNVFVGKTPTTVTLSSKGGYFKGKTYLVRICKDNCETQTLEVRSNMNGWYIGNLLFGGLIGLLIVDPLTGAMWTLDPKEIDVTLARKTSDVPGDQRILSIVHFEDVPDSIRYRLIRIK